MGGAPDGSHEGHAHAGHGHAHGHTGPAAT